MKPKAKYLFIALIINTLFSCSGQTKNSNPKEKMEKEDRKGNPYYSRTDTNSIRLSNEEWKKVLPHDVYEVARNKDTERPFTGKYWNTSGLGKYYCAACGNALFKSDSKFSSTCGWPSFYEALDKTKIVEKLDKSHGMMRMEILCAKCGGHLGHVFNDGPQDKTGLRYCVNSLSLDFKKRIYDSTQTK
jgi:peptide-methionine (R)-S-oxide reductase